MSSFEYVVTGFHDGHLILMLDWRQLLLVAPNFRPHQISHPISLNSTITIWLEVDLVMSSNACIRVGRM